VGEEVEFVINAVMIGVGATIFMDIWAVFQKRVFGVPALNYAMVGRWIGHLPSGCLVHDNIGKTPPIQTEKLLGWSAHYAIGIFFASILLVIWGPGWASGPTLAPALTVGLVTVAAPFFILQPGMGAGIMASKTPIPNTSRLRSVIAHTSFGMGLYFSALLWSLIHSV